MAQITFIRPSVKEEETKEETITGTVEVTSAPFPEKLEIVLDDRFYSLIERKLSEKLGDIKIDININNPSFNLVMPEPKIVSEVIETKQDSEVIVSNKDGIINKILGVFRSN